MLVGIPSALSKCRLEQQSHASVNGKGLLRVALQARMWCATRSTAATTAKHRHYQMRQDGRVAEGRRVGRPQPQPDRSRPLLGPRSCPEAQGGCRDRFSTPTDGVVDEMRAAELQRDREPQRSHAPLHAHVRCVRCPVCCVLSLTARWPLLQLPCAAATVAATAAVSRCRCHQLPQPLAATCRVVTHICPPGCCLTRGNISGGFFCVRMEHIVTPQSSLSDYPATDPAC